MRELLNTLYVQTPGTVLHLDHDAVLARQDGEPAGRLPLRRLMGIAVIGRVSVTPSLIHRCAEDGIAISWFNHRGRHSGTLRGRTSGNVLLRLAQYRHHDDVDARLDLARTIVAGSCATRRGLLGMPLTLPAEARPHRSCEPPLHRSTLHAGPCRMQPRSTP